MNIKQLLVEVCKNYWDNITFIFKIKDSTLFRIVAIIISLSGAIIYSLFPSKDIIDFALNIDYTKALWLPLLPFCIMPFTLIIKCIKLQNELNNRHKKDNLVLKLQSLLEHYTTQAGYLNSYYIFHTEVVKALKESGVISQAEIYEFKNPCLPCHLLENEVNKIITKLKY